MCKQLLTHVYPKPEAYWHHADWKLCKAMLGDLQNLNTHMWRQFCFISESQMCVYKFNVITSKVALIVTLASPLSFSIHKTLQLYLYST